MANRGAKGPLDKQLPILKMKRMTKDSVAIARTPAGDTIWRNTGARSKGGVFWHPKDAKGKPEGRHYLEGKLKREVNGE